MSPGAATSAYTGLDLERRAFILRKRVEHELSGVYFPSLSSRTLVYKGMLTAPQLGQFWSDLDDERMVSALALVHSRFSTNTFPSWPLAHPFRYVAHNGEINTVKGNRNWMRAREALLASDVLPGDLSRLFPVVDPRGSDSASFDEVLELLHLGGRSLAHSVLMMIPEAWENHAEMSAEKRAFYQFHAAVMEPWDGPASIAFTDGTVIGAVLDRNGLRPSRYWVTDDGLVVMASEVGVLDIPQSQVVERGRLQPGRMFLVDTARGRIVSDDEIKTGTGRGPPLRRVAGRPADPFRRPTEAVVPDPAARLHGGPSAAVRLHRGGPQGAARPHGPGRGRTPRFHGYRHAAGRAVGPSPGPLRLFQPDVRPGDQPRRWTPSGRSWSPPWPAPSAPRATCWTPSRPVATRSSCPSPS